MECAIIRFTACTRVEHEAVRCTLLGYITQTITFGGLCGEQREKERVQRDRNDDDRGPPGANQWEL